MLFENKQISEIQVFNEPQIYSQPQANSIKKDGTPRKNAKRLTGEEPKKTKELSIREKISLIDYSQTHTVRDTAREFKVGLGTVVNIKKRREEYLRLDNEQSLSLTRKRKLKHTPYGELNKLCWTWFSKSRSMNIPLSGPIIQETARKFAAELKLPGFKGSNGWLLSFTKAHNINLKVISGNETPGESDAGVKFLNNVKNICKDYQPQDIFNMDETALCWRALPERSWLETQKLSRGSKVMREKVVVLLAISATGERLRPLVVGRSLPPQCGKIINMHKFQVDYRYNKTAWMTSTIFKDWLQTVNDVFLRQNRKTLFFVHSSPFHPFIDLSNITLCFLPNYPSFLQPLDHAVTHSFKTNYRKSLLKHLIVSTDLRINSKVTFFDMLMWIKKAWQDLPSHLIHNSFSHSGFNATSEVTTPSTSAAIESDNNAELDELINQAHNLYLVKDKLTADEFQQFDKALEEMQHHHQGDLFNGGPEVGIEAEPEEDIDTCIDYHIAMLHVKELKQFTVHNDVNIVDEILNIERKLHDSIVGSQRFALSEFFY